MLACAAYVRWQACEGYGTYEAFISGKINEGSNKACYSAEASKFGRTIQQHTGGKTYYLEKVLELFQSQSDWVFFCYQISKLDFFF